MSLRLQAVEKKLGTFSLGPIDLELEAGERLAIIGPSGSGKSTLLRIIAGLMAPDGGRIYINGVDVTKAGPRERGVAMVFQSPALFPTYTVLENVAEPLRARGVDRKTAREAAMEALRRVGLSHLADRFPGQLSRGQQQRVSLARALVLNPKILLFDEPLASVDPPLRGELLPYIHEAARGKTVLYVTHDFEEATFLADKILVLIDGRPAAFGRAVEIFEKPPSPKVAQFLGYVNAVKAPCGVYYFRPWDVSAGSSYRGRVLAKWYRAGWYEVIVDVGGTAVRLYLPDEPKSGEIAFDVKRGVCYQE